MSMPDQVDKKPLPEEIGQLLAPYSSELQSTLEQFIGTPYNDQIRDFYPWGYGWVCGRIVLPGQLETREGREYVNRVLSLHYSVKDRKIPMVDLNRASVKIEATGMSRQATLNIHLKGRNITELSFSWRSSDRNDLLDAVGGDTCLGILIGRFDCWSNLSSNRRREVYDSEYRPNTELTFTYRSKALGLAFRQQVFQHWVEEYESFLVGSWSRDQVESINLGSRFRYVPKKDKFKSDQRSEFMVMALEGFGLSFDPTLSREEFVGVTQGLLDLIPSSGNFAHPPR